MPYPSDHKAKTRAKIVTSARSLFNRRGFEQVTIDEIMANAGLTRGAFYHHFGSKDALFAEAVASIAQCSPFSREAARRGPLDDAEKAHLFVDLYLAEEMLSNVAEQCPLYALPSDVARAGRAVRAEYTIVLERLLRVLRAGCGDAEVERRAFATLALCVGAMVLARTTQDAAIARRVRSSAREAAHELLGATHRPAAARAAKKRAVARARPKPRSSRAATPAR